MAGGQQGQAPQAQPQSQGPNPDTDPNNADYEPPENGPFRCDNCTFYGDPNQCNEPHVQAGPQKGVVDPAGCCKFFSSLVGASNQASTPNANQPNSNIHQYGK